mgnify:CR=1 FL=1
MFDGRYIYVEYMPVSKVWLAWDTWTWKWVDR